MVGVRLVPAPGPRVRRGQSKRGTRRSRSRLLRDRSEMQLSDAHMAGVRCNRSPPTQRSPVEHQPKWSTQVICSPSRGDAEPGSGACPRLTANYGFHRSSRCTRRMGYMFAMHRYVRSTAARLYGGTRHPASLGAVVGGRKSGGRQGWRSTSHLADSPPSPKSNRLVEPMAWAALLRTSFASGGLPSLAGPELPPDQRSLAPRVMSRAGERSVRMAARRPWSWRSSRRCRFAPKVRCRCSALTSRAGWAPPSWATSTARPHQLPSTWRLCCTSRRGSDHSRHGTQLGRRRARSRARAALPRPARCGIMTTTTSSPPRTRLRAAHSARNPAQAQAMTGRFIRYER